MGEMYVKTFCTMSNAIEIQDCIIIFSLVPDGEAHLEGSIHSLNELNHEEKNYRMK